MRFALLGSGAHALDLVDAVRRSPEHQLVLAFEVPDPTISELLPARSSGPNDFWESLLLGSPADAVIVGDTDDIELRAEQLRKLVQASVPMILVHPACEAIVGYELDMIRHDSGCVMIPYCPGAWHPVLGTLRQILSEGAESSIGQVEQLVLERRMHCRQRKDVLIQFARDALLIRRVFGNIEQLSALGPQPTQDNYANLSVHMSSGNDVVARWSCRPAGEKPSARLSVLATAGEAIVEMSDAGWTCHIPRFDSAGCEPSGWHEPTAVIESLVESVAGGTPQLSWEDASRAADVAEIVEISLRRGRTIELHNEQHTEESTFKGMMAIGGCGTLLITLLLVLLVAVVDSMDIAAISHPIWREYWPFYLIGLLSLFLLLQLLWLLFPKSPSPDVPSIGEKTESKQSD